MIYIKHFLIPLFILFILYAIDSTGEEKLYTVTDLKMNTCQNICNSDGDKRGILVNGQCGCWNPRDISKYIFKIDRNLRVDVPADVKPRLDD